MMASANAKTKSVKKSTPRISAEELSALLENTPINLLPLKKLVISFLNVRTIPYPVESVKSLAETIKSVGLLQNLVVHLMPDGMYGVAAGGRRLSALELLKAIGFYNDETLIAVKIVPEAIARAVSMIENGQRVDMHPAEQIVGFRQLEEEGKSPAQIGDIMGYPSRHVQRCLKLASLDNELLAALARDEITLDQCQVMTQVEPSLQLEVWESAKKNGYDKCRIDTLKEMVGSGSVRTTSPMFMFIGKEAWEAAGHTIEVDLFSESEGSYVDKLLLESMVRQKLEAEALRLQEAEGWSWSAFRQDALVCYGNDGRDYELDEPEADFTDEEQAKYDDLQDALDATTTCDDENEIQQKIEDMEAAAIARLMTPDYLAERGVFVSFADGDFKIQRGVKKVVAGEDEEEHEPEPKRTGGIVTLDKKPDVAEGISLPLLTAMSSERTLAVQAALMQQTERAVAMLAWTLCQSVFGGRAYYHPVQVRLDCSHHSLTSNAPSHEKGEAYVALMQEKSRLQSFLPTGWETDFTTFFSLPNDVLHAFMGYCTAVSIYGVQTRECGHTKASQLDGLEAALGFHLRDWWQPTETGYFGQISKPMIVAALKDAGLTGAASDAEKMKKRDAAELAAEKIAETRWVPAWMSGPQPEQATDDLIITDHAA